MVPQNIKNFTSLQEFKRLVKVWKPEACSCRMCKKLSKYWFHLIKHGPFIEPKEKDQTFMLIIHNEENENNFMSRYTRCRIN